MLGFLAFFVWSFNEGLPPLCLAILFYVSVPPCLMFPSPSIALRTVALSALPAVSPFLLLSQARVSNGFTPLAAGDRTEPPSCTCLRPFTCFSSWGWSSTSSSRGLPSPRSVPGRFFFQVIYDVSLTPVINAHLTPLTLV